MQRFIERRAVKRSDSSVTPPAQVIVAMKVKNVKFLFRYRPKPQCRNKFTQKTGRGSIPQCYGRIRSVRQGRAESETGDLVAAPGKFAGETVYLGRYAVRRVGG